MTARPHCLEGGVGGVEDARHHAVRVQDPIIILLSYTSCRHSHDGSRENSSHHTLSGFHYQRWSRYVDVSRAASLISAAARIHTFLALIGAAALHAHMHCACKIVIVFRLIRSGIRVHSAFLFESRRDPSQVNIALPLGVRPKREPERPRCTFLRTVSCVVLHTHWQSCTGALERDNCISKLSPG